MGARRNHVTNHDKEGDVGGSQGLQRLRLLWGSPVVERGACDVEAPRRVDGELPVDVVLAALPSQRCEDGGASVRRTAERTRIQLRPGASRLPGSEHGSNRG